MYAEVAMVQSLLEGVPLPASRDELIDYAGQQGDHVPLGLLERLPEREYKSLDEVGEALVPVQPDVATNGPPLPRAESDLPPGGDAYLEPSPIPGAVRHDAPPDNPPQKAIEQQTTRQNEQKRRQDEQLDA